MTPELFNTLLMTAGGVVLGGISGGLWLLVVRLWKDATDLEDRGMALISTAICSAVSFFAIAVIIKAWM